MADKRRGAEAQSVGEENDTTHMSLSEQDFGVLRAQLAVTCPIADTATVLTTDDQSLPYAPNTPLPEPSVTENLLTVHLLRYFAEVPAQWYAEPTFPLSEVPDMAISRMDLFDSGAYYSRKVPIMAATGPLLRSSASALAAKHLSRHTDGGKRLLRDFTAQSSLNTQDIDWSYKSVEYYDQAISFLMSAARLVGEDHHETGYSDEVLASVAILSMYELMDAPGPEWKTHLSALPLVDTSSFKILDAQPHIHIPRNLVKRSIFWNLARQDCLAACKPCVSYYCLIS